MSKQKTGRKVNELWDKVCSAFPVDHRSPVTAGLSFIFQRVTPQSTSISVDQKDPINVSNGSKGNSGDVCVALASENWMTERMHEAEAERRADVDVRLCMQVIRRRSASVGWDV